MKSFARWALRFAVSALLIGWLLSRVDLADVADRISGIGLDRVLLVLALQLVNTGLKSYKWQRLLAADGIVISHASAFGSYLVGTFFNLFLPSSVGGDAVRAVDASRRSGRKTATVTSVAADRILGFAALGTLGATALLLGGGAVLERGLLLAGLATYGLLAVTGLALFSPPAARFLGTFAGRGRVGAIAASVGGSLGAYRDSGRLAELFAVSLAAQSIVIFAVFTIAEGIGIDAPLSWFFVAVPLVGVIEALPISIYGIGLRDVSYVQLLGLVGVGEAQALSLSVLYVLLTMLYALFGGAVFLMRRTAAEEAKA